MVEDSDYRTGGAWVRADQVGVASLAGAAPGSRYQFLRQGYFCVDSRDSTTDALVFNRTVSLRDTWARTQQRSQG